MTTPPSPSRPPHSRPSRRTRYIPPHRDKDLILPCVAAGIVLALLAVGLGAQGHPSLAFTLLLGFPVIVIAATYAYPSLRAAGFFGLAVAGGLSAGVLPLGGMPEGLPAMFMVAGLASMILCPIAWITALLFRPRVVFGNPPVSLNCLYCGYSLEGLDGRRECPECAKTMTREQHEEVNGYKFKPANPPAPPPTSQAAPTDTPQNTP